MKRERESDGEEASGQSNNTGSGAFSTGYGIFNPGYSFVRPPGVQSKPTTKRSRVGDGSNTTYHGPVKFEPRPKEARVLGIKAEPQEEDLYGLEPGIGPSRRSSSNMRDIQTPKHNISNVSGVQTPIHNSNLPVVQTQALIQHPRENNRQSIVGNGPSEDGKSLPIFFCRS